MSEPTPVALSRFSYWYGGQRVLAALDQIDLRLDPGLTAVAGASGSGKSTLLRVFNGLVPHFHGGTVQGCAAIFGRDVLHSRTRDLAEMVGFLFQDPELQSVYGTVERDVAFGLENMRVPRAEMISRVDEALIRTGISHLRQRDVRTLSGGERQRLALAGVLVLRPSVLALDEPLSQLDDGGARALLDTLDDLAAAGVTVAVAEHRLNELLPRAYRLLRIDRGTLAEDRAVLGGGRDGSSETVSEPRRTALGAQVEVRVSGGTPAGFRPRGLSRPVSSSAPATRSPQPTSAWQLRSVTAGPAGEAVLSEVELGGGAGEVVVLMGPNGGGKTTLLRTIAGLIAPLSGRVERVEGRVAYLPQNPTALLHRPTVRAEVDLTLRRSADHEAADVVLASLGLGAVAHRYPRDLSTGERQRTALAAVLAGRPKIALLDEPTRGMDDAAREALQRLIARLAERGTAVVLATHDRDLAARVASRIVRVDGGAVRESAPAGSAAAASA